MALGEFDRIRTCFRPLTAGFEPALQLQDDAALLRFPSGRPVAVSTDTLIAGVHFPADERPELVASKALRVNLSDMAAMGAEPVAYLLALTLPSDPDFPADSWLQDFAAGLAADQQRFAVRLAGGDSTVADGPLTATVTILGTVAPAGPLLRSGGRPGDDIYVSGTIGDAGLGLDLVKGLLSGIPEDHESWLRDRYRQPQPRTGLARHLVGHATAAIDVSDGLVQDLGHLAAASGCGAILHADLVPLSDAAQPIVAADPARHLALLGAGDDYELLFTADPGRRPAIAAAGARAGTALSCIGALTEAGPVRVLDRAGTPLLIDTPGYRHA